MTKKSHKKRSVSDPNWYKNAIVYQTHVKAFFDSNDDGIGDFPGITQKLDYIKELGVNTIWLLPFYPSPFRDDGYDISDYYDVHPSYGQLSDFKLFLKEAHKRNLRVITELVVNHTSDTHPWFQAARQAPKTSAKRNYYIWSDNDEKFPDVRIIFTDTETSNWTWDPVAKAYYWHRFFSHQPDLNFNNPQVVKKLISVMRFWLDMGVDGLRLDAIPYLCVREGTNCENLPETHQVIKQFRAELDKRYSDRILLAEANQWPEDAAEYFGEGDECHMAFHFPLMPRMYMALALEDRYPIVEILKQTPEIPANCQWAIFLRNHDELTLEMVTNEERDYMYQTYASDPRTRINVGIRRRLSPLMKYNRAKIELMNALLLSMPGSPIIYYGDEIGMGDNVFLGDRNGVRTPMQWTPDRNGGFSKADPEKLYLPAIMEAITGFQAVNVESQSKNPSSLLNWMKRLINVRKQFKAFGEGEMHFIQPANRSILAFTRSSEDINILCIANLSRSTQPVHINLQEFAGLTPIELIGKNAFPVIGEEPYQLSLAGYGFYWFELSAQADGPAWQEQAVDGNEKTVLVFRSSATSKHLPEPAQLFKGKVFEKLTGEALPNYFNHKRWFAGKGRATRNLAAEMRQSVVMADGFVWAFSIYRAELSDGSTQRYFCPLHLDWQSESTTRASAVWLVAKIRQQHKMGSLFDSMVSDAFCHSILKGMQNNETIRLEQGTIKFRRGKILSEKEDLSYLPIKRPIVEQSHTSVFFGEKFIFKMYRLLQPGKNPELEIGQYFSQTAGFKNIARVGGWIEFETNEGKSFTLGIMQEFINNQSDFWSFTLNYLDRHIDSCRMSGFNEAQSIDSESPHEMYLNLIDTLGQRVGSMHCQLAAPSENENFKPALIEREDWLAWAGSIEASLVKALFDMSSRIESFSLELQPKVRKFIDSRKELTRRLRALIPSTPDIIKTRHHGDLHLGQILLTGSDFIIIDFEGEPTRPMPERSRKHSPIRDIAGMLRSFSYAANMALKKVIKEQPDMISTASKALKTWEQVTSDQFLAGYMKTGAKCASIPESEKEFKRILDLFYIEKALYEFNYEMANRPDWVEIPVKGLISSLKF